MTFLQSSYHYSFRIVKWQPYAAKRLMALPKGPETCSREPESLLIFRRLNLFFPRGITPSFADFLSMLIYSLWTIVANSLTSDCLRRSSQAAIANTCSKRGAANTRRERSSPTLVARDHRNRSSQLAVTNGHPWRLAPLEARPRPQKRISGASLIFYKKSYEISMSILCRIKYEILFI